MASMSRRLFRATVDGRVLLVEVDGATARVGAEDERAPSQLASDAQALTFSIEPFDNGASNVTSARVREGRATDEREPATATATATATPTATAAGAARHVHTAIDNGVVWTFIDGEVFRIELDDAERATRARHAAGDEALAAPMPATVIKLLVEPGQTVERGDSLLLLEAMKMELPIRAPRPGRVSAFHCKAGDLVQPGVPLVDLDAP
jgi:biotin carboxyl carrier protein